jgi:ribosome-binding protein aMBF1 (putative translation factor)
MENPQIDLKRLERFLAALRAAGPQQGKDHDSMVPDFAQAVRERREVLGWSQAKLAREARVNVETVRMVEDGRTQPRPDTVEKIGDALTKVTH